MGFSEKMRESLGAGGVRLRLAVPNEPLPIGSTSSATVTFVGGNRPAKIDALVVRVVEADRFWHTPEGSRISEEEAQAMSDRGDLVADWSRRTVSEHRIELDRDVDENATFELEIEPRIPENCSPSGPACSHTLNVQADIKGQIDPTANARIRLRPSH